MTLAAINALPQRSFVQELGWVFEESLWVAARAWAKGPFKSAAALHAALVKEVEAAPAEEQLALLRAHPDLGTRARLSAASAGEQSGAGLDSLTREEFNLLHDLNTTYRERFGFPFLFAVKGSTKYDILSALERRVHSAPEAEFPVALDQVYRIASFRLHSIFEGESKG